MQTIGRSCALILSLATCVSASSLTVVTSNISPAASNIAILVDGGTINGSVSATYSITPGQSTSTRVITSLPDGPFRVRVLSYNTQTGRPLQTGRALSVAADGTAAVLLGDVGAFGTTPDITATHGGQKVVTFGVRDPGGWLEGTRQKVFVYPRASQLDVALFATLRNLSPSGQWEASATIPVPISGDSLSYGISLEFPVPQGNALYLSGDFQNPLRLVDASSVILTVAGLPPAANGLFLLADRGGITGTLSAFFAVQPDSTGRATVQFGLVPGGPYRLRAVAVVPGTGPSLGATGILAASGHTLLTIPAGPGTALTSLQVQPMSATFEQATVAIGRWVSPRFLVTDPGSVLEGVFPAILNGPNTGDIRSYVYADERFQKVGPNTFRSSGTMNATVYFLGASTMYYTVGVAPFAEGLWYYDLRFSNEPATVAINSGIPCAPNPLPYIGLNASGGGTYFTAPVPNGCPWTVRSTVPWLRVHPTSGVGPTTVTWTAAPNFTKDFRSGYLLFGDVTLSVSEQKPAEDSDTRFIRQLYFNFLGRYPSDAEIAGQKAALAGGFTRAALANNFASSAEFQLAGRYIAGLYFGILARDAELAGWLFQRDALVRGVATYNGLVDNFLNSPEFALKNGPLDNASFIRLLYRNILLREASDAEVYGQLQALVSGSMTRNTMASAFLGGQEFARLAGPRLTAFILYATLLERDGSTQELTEAAAQIEGGMSQLALIDQVLNSREFERY